MGGAGARGARRVRPGPRGVRGGAGGGGGRRDAGGSPARPRASSTPTKEPTNQPSLGLPLPTSRPLITQWQCEGGRPLPAASVLGSAPPPLPPSLLRGRAPPGIRPASYLVLAISGSHGRLLRGCWLWSCWLWCCVLRWHRDLWAGVLPGRPGRPPPPHQNAHCCGRVGLRPLELCSAGWRPHQLCLSSACWGTCLRCGMCLPAACPPAAPRRRTGYRRCPAARLGSGGRPHLAIPAAARGTRRPLRAWGCGLPAGTALPALLGLGFRDPRAPSRHSGLTPQHCVAAAGRGQPHPGAAAGRGPPRPGAATDRGPHPGTAAGWGKDPCSAARRAHALSAPHSCSCRLGQGSKGHQPWGTYPISTHPSAHALSASLPASCPPAQPSLVHSVQED